MPGHQEFRSLLPFLFSLFISFASTFSKGTLYLRPKGLSSVQYRDRIRPHACMSTRIPTVFLHFECYWLNLQSSRSYDYLNTVSRSWTAFGQPFMIWERCHFYFGEIEKIRVQGRFRTRTREDGSLLHLSTARYRHRYGELDLHQSKQGNKQRLTSILFWFRQGFSQTGFHAEACQNIIFFCAALAS